MMLQPKSVMLLGLFLFSNGTRLLDPEKRPKNGDMMTESLAQGKAQPRQITYLNNFFIPLPFIAINPILAQPPETMSALSNSLSITPSIIRNPSISLQPFTPPDLLSTASRRLTHHRQYSTAATTPLIIIETTPEMITEDTLVETTLEPLLEITTEISPDTTPEGITEPPEEIISESTTPESVSETILESISKITLEETTTETMPEMITGTVETTREITAETIFETSTSISDMTTTIRSDDSSETFPDRPEESITEMSQDITLEIFSPTTQNMILDATKETFVGIKSGAITANPAFTTRKHVTETPAETTVVNTRNSTSDSPKKTTLLELISPLKRRVHLRPFKHPYYSSEASYIVTEVSHLTAGH